VGEYTDRFDHLHGFVVHSGGFQTINFPGTLDTVVEGINDFGDMVGFFVDQTNLGFIRSFLRHKGRFTKFSFPGADPGTTSAMSINNSGVIVGIMKSSPIITALWSRTDISAPSTFLERQKPRSLRSAAMAILWELTACRLGCRMAFLSRTENSGPSINPTHLSTRSGE
jgi:hypothetical protein